MKRNVTYPQVSNIRRTLVGNCWSLRCSWSIACRRCSNYIFILNLTPGFIESGKDNYKMRRGAFKFWDLVHLILETLRYVNLVFQARWSQQCFKWASQQLSRYDCSSVSEAILKWLRKTNHHNPIRTYCTTTTKQSTVKQCVHWGYPVKRALYCAWQVGPFWQDTLDIWVTSHWH